MWIFDGNNVSDSLLDWAEDFKDFINKNYTGNSKHDRATFLKALNAFVQEHFVYKEEQDKFVNEVGVDECVTWARDASSWKTIRNGLSFIQTVLDAVFSQTFYWEEDTRESWQQKHRNRIFETRHRISRR